MEPRIVEQARVLRERGQTPKAIARALGISPAEVVAALNTDVPGPSAAAGSSDEPRCWASTGWSRCVDLGEVPQWAGFDLPTDTVDEDRALVSVFVAQESRRSSKVVVTGFLLDVWCLGVKNAYVPEPMTPSAAAEFRQLFYRAYDGHVPIPADLARDLVHGAADYAASLGFEPQADFGLATALLARPDGPPRIRFGRDGRPFYINGPYDNAEKVLRTLRRAVGDNGFGHVMIHGE